MYTPFLPPTQSSTHLQTQEGKYPFGSVPVLEVDGVTYAQSVGILRYVGRLGGLYPDAPLAGLAIDQIVGGVEDMIVATVCERKGVYVLPHLPIQPQRSDDEGMLPPRTHALIVHRYPICLPGRLRSPR